MEKDTSLKGNMPKNTRPAAHFLSFHKVKMQGPQKSTPPLDLCAWQYFLFTYVWQLNITKLFSGIYNFHFPLDQTYPDIPN
jgi:hypothetical protein